MWIPGKSWTNIFDKTFQEVKDDPDFKDGTVEDIRIAFEQFWILGMKISTTGFFPTFEFPGFVKMEPSQGLLQKAYKQFNKYRIKKDWSPNEFFKIFIGLHDSVHRIYYSNYLKFAKKNVFKKYYSQGNETRGEILSAKNFSPGPLKVWPISIRARNTDIEGINFIIEQHLGESMLLHDRDQNHTP
jgi:hypothetical protein